MLKSVAFGVALTIAGLGSALAGDPAGTWTTAEGRAHVRIAACGPALCGTIVWLREPNGPDGRPKLDDMNEDATKRTRPIIGSQVLLALAPDGADQWKGRIYNAEDGKTYSATFTLQGATTAQVKGCVAAIFCKSQTWTRN